MVDPMLTVSMAEQQVVVDSAEMNCRVQAIIRFLTAGAYV